MMNGKLEVLSKATDRMMTFELTEPEILKASKVQCSTWNNQTNWSFLKPASASATQITCSFREFGYFSVTGIVSEYGTTSTTETTSSSSSSSSTTTHSTTEGRYLLR